MSGCQSTGELSVDKALTQKLLGASVEVLANGKMQGSGALVSADGYVLTAAHYISSSSIKLEVLTAGQLRAEAKLVAIDKGDDIALLKIESAKALPYLEISSEELHAGDKTYIVGSPLFKHRLLLEGMISSIQPSYIYLDDQKSYLHINYIQTMASRGLSGGCWTNSKGEVIGVQSGFLNDQVSGTDGHANSGIAFIAGLDEVRTLFETKKHVPATSLGCQLEELWTQNPGFQERFPSGTEGVAICAIREDGPMAKAEFVKDTIITAIDGTKVRYISEIMSLVRAKKPGDKMSVTTLFPDDKGSETKEVILDCQTDNWANRK